MAEVKNGNGNGFVVRVVLWTLVLACFGYTYATNARVDATAIKLADEVVCNDRLNQKEHREIEACFSEKLEDIQTGITDIKMMLAPLAKQVEINTERITKLENKK